MERPKITREEIDRTIDIINRLIEEINGDINMEKINRENRIKFLTHGLDVLFDSFNFYEFRDDKLL